MVQCDVSGQRSQVLGAVSNHGELVLHLGGIDKFAPRYRHVIRALADVTRTIAAIEERDSCSEAAAALSGLSWKLKLLPE